MVPSHMVEIRASVPICSKLHSLMYLLRIVCALLTHLTLEIVEVQLVQAHLMLHLVESSLVGCLLELVRHLSDTVEQGQPTLNEHLIGQKHAAEREDCR